MKELLQHIVKGIVNNPDAVEVEERESVDFPGLTILEISVDSEDKGILIGRRGRTINAIRDIMTISAIRNEKRIKVLVKDDKPREKREESVQQVQEEEIAPGNELPQEVVSEETEDMLTDEL
jgi:predicted RNA-binding protein YlqC (UPF0109 family)